MDILKNLLPIFIGLASGVVVAGGVFAFIAVIGIVPRMAQRSGTNRYIMVYEDAIMVGGLLGTLALAGSPHLGFGFIFAVIFALAVGIFVGSLAISLAEVLDAIPIILRRFRLGIGVSLFILALALGKMTGALLYSLIPGFYS